ncbi:MAG: hypothetical protein PHU71_02290 [Candidatus Gracilibacteria bacterium]|nr:hypothetical protein [Candidatus Gracilibacteria bacterium]
MLKPLVMTLLILIIISLATFFILHYGESSGVIDTHITSDILDYFDR